MYFPFDFLVGGNFSLTLLGFLELVLVDGMFLPHILSSLPCDNTLLTCPPSQLFHSTATEPTPQHSSASREALKLVGSLETLPWPAGVINCTPLSTLSF